MKKLYFMSCLIASTLNYTIIPYSEISIFAEGANEETTISYIHSDEYEFSCENVIVVLKREYSSLNREWSKDDFSIRNISSVEDLTYMSMDENEQQDYLQQVDFHQILRIRLEEPSRDGVLTAIEELEECNSILLAEPDFYLEECSTIPNDISIPPNYYALPTAKFYDVWDIETGSSNVKVGIIDNGIANISDLSGNVDYSLGYDAYNNNTVTYDDIDGHGTQVASVVGAIGNNSIGICGACWDVTLVPLQILGADEDNLCSYCIDALAHAQSLNLPIVNISQGTSYPDNALFYSIADYTGLVVCSAGNDGLNTDLDNHYPSSFPNDNIISVAASTSYNDNLADFSNYGATSVDLAAPGDDIAVLTNTGGCIMNSGTSFSAPMVTGAAALLLSYNPNLKALELKEALMKSAESSAKYRFMCK